MRAIVIDDENLALQSMVRMLEKDQVQVVGSFQDPREALRRQEELDADVAFVDIEMPELNGLELAARLQSANPRLHIVFVTAYEQYAIEAFELDAVDYLLKPLQAKRLDLTVKRLRAKMAYLPPAPEEAPKESCYSLTLFHHIGILDGRGHNVDIPWRTNKAKELFAYLVHSGSKTPNKDELLDRMWPDADLDKSVTHLHTTIYQIRQTLKNAGVPLGIQYKEGRYRIEYGNVEVDAQQWEKGLREATEANDDSRLYELLLHDYRGDYLETEGFLWAETERERLRTLWFGRTRRHAELLEQRGKYVDAIPLYQKIQQHYPELEESYFGLMRLYDKQSNPTEVQAQYERLVRMTREEYEGEPDDAITAWFAEWSERRYS